MLMQQNVVDVGGGDRLSMHSDFSCWGMSVITVEAVYSFPSVEDTQLTSQGMPCVTGYAPVNCL